MPGDVEVGAMREHLRGEVAGVETVVARLLGLSDSYRRAASGPAGEPNRANEALLSLERAAAEVRRALDCLEHPTGGSLG